MKRPQKVTEAELVMVKKSLLFPVILDVLTYDSKHMEITGVKIPIIYNLLLKGKQQQAINDITQELNAVKREMRLCGIKILQEKRTNLSIEAEYLCRGYPYHFSMLWGFVKAEVQKKLSVYFDTHQGVIHE
ncbi:hypothetical protein EHS13_15290 [Paenibacillus psychroresistens]|uniref:Uncharacterized protein n=1 Tax=Paenibacillus psychroresistens TaxID=1778678 RepID=A0A6B8RKL9_9BACL|nr:hypothetical protein [Paenibacillus psychroresistens]QGQ96142.1 hypothetical protein EHS13_15290 [Paenibacillus psychroresistens]